MNKFIASSCYASLFLCQLNVTIKSSDLAALFDESSDFFGNYYYLKERHNSDLGNKYYFPMDFDRHWLIANVKNGNLNVTDKHRDSSITALMQAAKNGDKKMVDLLLAHGATLTIDAFDNSLNSRPTLILTLSKDMPSSIRTGIVQSLIAAQANINLADQYGQTPLWHAASLGSEKLVALCLSAGASINTENQRFDQSALNEAIRANREKSESVDAVGVTQRLIAAGANVMEIHHGDWTEHCWHLPFYITSSIHATIPAARTVVQQEQRKLLTQWIAHINLPADLTKLIAPFLIIGLDYSEMCKETNYRKALIAHRKNLLNQNPTYAQELLEKEQLSEKRKNLAGYNPDQIAERKLELRHLEQQKRVSTAAGPDLRREIEPCWATRGALRWFAPVTLERKLNERDGIHAVVTSSHKQYQTKLRIISYGHLAKKPMITDREARPRRKLLPRFVGKYYREDCIDPGHSWNTTEAFVNDID